MPLESSSFISGLTSSWPIAGDPKSQGDDHLRLIKTALQGTFPSADRALYFPKAEATAVTLTLDVTDQNNEILVTTTAGDVSVVLPSGFDTTKSGWSCEVIKVSADQNAAVVTPAVGTILSRSGSTASIRVGALCEAARFIWTGSAWVCLKPGIAVGATMNWDAPTVPYGFFTLDGTTFSSTTFAELALVLGTTTLRDKRGRIEAGIDTATGRLGGQVAGASGSVGGAPTVALSVANLASHFHSEGISDPGHGHPLTGPTSTTTGVDRTAGGSFPTYWTGTQTINTTAVGTGIRANSSNGLDTTYSAGSDTAHANVQPMIITNKLIRAC